MMNRPSSRLALLPCLPFLAFVLAGASLPALAAERHFDVAISAGALVGSDTTLQVEQDDSVTLRLVSDQALELHLHGYDLELALSAGEPATLSFVATFSGRFPLEAHGTAPGQRQSVLLYLEVHPD